jgi:hypothetical protein
MKKIALVALALVVLTGCQPVHTSDQPAPSSNSRFNPIEICVNGVTYYQFYGPRRLAVAVAYNTDGTIKLCDQ